MKNFSKMLLVILFSFLPSESLPLSVDGIACSATFLLPGPFSTAANVAKFFGDVCDGGLFGKLLTNLFPCDDENKNYFGYGDALIESLQKDGWNDYSKEQLQEAVNALSDSIFGETDWTAAAQYYDNFESVDDMALRKLREDNPDLTDEKLREILIKGGEEYMKQNYGTEKKTDESEQSSESNSRKKEDDKHKISKTAKTRRRGDSDKDKYSSS